MILNEEFLRQRNILAHSHFDNQETRILNENRQIFEKSQKYDLFISHSYMDKSLVLSLVELFNKAGYSVYVDWIIDSALDRNKVDQKTAELLRTRMDECKGLAYIATSNIVSSRWCPWELGYADGAKNGRCAILPILKSNNNTYKGQEYLGLYPYIDCTKSSKQSNYNFWVNDPVESNKFTPLKNWLAGGELTKH